MKSDALDEHTYLFIKHMAAESETLTYLLTGPTYSTITGSIREDMLKLRTLFEDRHPDIAEGC
jgi:hypothetical protein